jgi:hypothetical protein
MLGSVSRQSPPSSQSVKLPISSVSFRVTTGAGARSLPRQQADDVPDERRNREVDHEREGQQDAPFHAAKISNRRGAYPMRWYFSRIICHRNPHDRPWQRPVAVVFVTSVIRPSRSHSTQSESALSSLGKVRQYREPESKTAKTPITGIGCDKYQLRTPEPFTRLRLRSSAGRCARDSEHALLDRRAAFVGPRRLARAG